MFRYIGIDWGEKVCGVAFGDNLTELIITSREEFKTSEVYDRLIIEIKNREISHIVVGYPLNFHGKRTRVTSFVDNFIKQLEKLFPDCTVSKVDERGTTKKSFEKLGKSWKYRIDNQSAAEILERYFEQNSK